MGGGRGGEVVDMQQTRIEALEKQLEALVCMCVCASEAVGRAV